MKRLLAIIFLPLILMLSACSGEDEIMEEELYMNIVAEFSIINQMDDSAFRDLSREEKREAIYEHFGVTEEEFRISHDYYQSDVATQLTRMEAVAAMLRAERDSIQDAEREFRQKLELLKREQEQAADSLETVETP